MEKVFGYPTFDQNGEEILCTYDNEYRAMLMDVRVYRMESGQERTFCRTGEETAVLLLSGKVTFSWDGSPKPYRARTYSPKAPMPCMCAAARR